MTKNKGIIATVMTLVMCLMLSAALAASPRASEVFVSGSVACTASMYTEFTASTKTKCDSIYVSSCTLQKKSGDSWTNDKTLTPPSKKASDATVLKAYADYDGKCGAGTYRIKAVFWADGATITRYSNERTF